MLNAAFKVTCVILVTRKLFFLYVVNVTNEIRNDMFINNNGMLCCSNNKIRYQEIRNKGV